MGELAGAAATVHDAPYLSCNPCLVNLQHHCICAAKTSTRLAVVIISNAIRSSCQLCGKGRKAAEVAAVIATGLMLLPDSSSALPTAVLLLLLSLGCVKVLLGPL
jgi:hypothetical protein